MDGHWGNILLGRTLYVGSSMIIRGIILIASILLLSVGLLTSLTPGLNNFLLPIEVTSNEAVIMMRAYLACLSVLDIYLFDLYFHHLEFKLGMSSFL